MSQDDVSEAIAIVEPPNTPFSLLLAARSLATYCVVLSVSRRNDAVGLIPLCLFALRHTTTSSVRHKKRGGGSRSPSRNFDKNSRSDGTRNRRAGGNRNRGRNNPARRMHGQQYSIRFYCISACAKVCGITSTGFDPLFAVCNERRCY